MFSQVAYLVRWTLSSLVWLFYTVCFLMCSQSSCFSDTYSHWQHLFRLLSTVSFQMFLQIATLNRCIVTLVTFVCLFTTMYFQMSFQCVFSNVYSNCLDEKMKSHICYICLFSPKCVFSYVSLNGQHLKMHNCIVGICLAFPRCAFSYVLSNCLPEWLRSCTGCICKVFPHCVFSSELSNWLQSGMHNHRVGTFLSLHHCVLSNGPLTSLHNESQSYTGCICLFFPYYVSSHVSSC